MKFTFPLDTPDCVIKRMEEIGFPLVFVEPQTEATLRVIVNRFLAGGLLIVYKLADGTQTLEVR